MKKGTFVGIDISKNTLDICIRFEDGLSLASITIANDVEAVRKFFSRPDLAGSIVGMENTGSYNWALLEVLPHTTCTAYMLCPIALKKSMGLKRGKTDQIDAAFICGYVALHHSSGSLVPWHPQGKDLIALKALLAQRIRRVKFITALKCAGADYRTLEGLDCEYNIKSLDSEALSLLKAQIKQIESEIEALVQASSTLSPIFSLMRSVPGAGKVLCWSLLAKTNGFTTLTDPRKMACYAGVVPFEHRSATSPSEAEVRSLPMQIKD